MNTVTEKDAAFKICPVRKKATCIGRECMAWRFADPVRQKFMRATKTDAELEVDAGAKPPGIDEWEFCPADGDEYAGWREPEAHRVRRLQRR